MFELAAASLLIHVLQEAFSVADGYQRVPKRAIQPLKEVTLTRTK